MKTRLALIAAWAAALAVAADPAGFFVWSAAELKGIDKKLTGQKMATQSLQKFDNHATSVAHREEPGQGELHETQTDLFVVENGTATLVVGGTLVNPKNSAPNEVRGTGIQGGVKKTVSAGDVIHIPIKTPHQFLVEKGKPFTYFVLKIDSK